MPIVGDYVRIRRGYQGDIAAPALNENTQAQVVSIETTDAGERCTLERVGSSPAGTYFSCDLVVVNAPGA